MIKGTSRFSARATDVPVPVRARDGLQQRLPVGWQKLRYGLSDFAMNWRSREQWESWRGDFFGGTVAALIAVPYGMALAVAIGLQPEAGLYTSIIGGAIAGMISNAPVVVSGLSATVVPVLALIVKTHGVGAALAAGALSGLIMFLIGVLRLGRFFSYLPHSVIGGFTSGLGVIIASSQFKSVFGVSPAHVSFDLGVIDEIWGVLQVLGQADSRTVIIATIVIAAMFFLPLWNRFLPASLAAVIMATVTAYLLGWQLPQVGALPDSLPQPSLTAMDFSAFSDLVHPALTLAGLITINQLLTVVVTDRMNQTPGEVKFDRELVAQGIANMACPFFGAPPGVAMLARTVASQRAGAATRWSVIAHSFVLLLFLLPLRNLISHIPLVVLAAVTVAVGFQLISWKSFRQLGRINRQDAALFLLTFGLVIFTDLIVGVGIGSLVAMLLFIERAANSTRIESVVPEKTSAEPADEIQMYRLAGPLFFASTEKVMAKLAREVTTKTLILDLTEAGPVDSAAIDCLCRIARQQRERGGRLHLVGIDQSLSASLAKGGLEDEETDHSISHYLHNHASRGVAETGAPVNLKSASHSGGKKT